MSVGRSRPQYSNRGAGQDETELTLCAPAPLSSLARADTLLLPPTDGRENFIRVQASSGGERHTAFPLWYVVHRIPMAQSTIRSEVTPSHRQVRRGLPGPDFLTHYHERCADASLPSSRNVTYLSAQQKTNSTMRTDAPAKVYIRCFRVEIGNEEGMLSSILVPKLSLWDA